MMNDKQANKMEKAEKKSDDWIVSIKQMLAKVERSSKLSIIKLVNLKEDAYTPSIVSFRPFHHRNKTLQAFEKHQQQYMLHLRRTSELCPLNSTDNIRRRDLIDDEAWALRSQEDWIWLQKSRQSWALKADRNTKLFHLNPNSRSMANLLNSISFNGVTLEQPSEVMEAIQMQSQLHFSDNWKCRPGFSAASGKVLSLSQNMNFLDESFSEDEIRNALNSCDGNKGPRPAGFNSLCIKRSWNILKGYFLQLFKEFDTNDKLVKGINSCFIALITEIINPISLSDYRHISFIDCVYKLLAKVLSDKLKKVIYSIIGEAQSAFIDGRNIQDWILNANKVVDFLKENKKQELILKLVYEKAFDSINWNYLLSMLQNFGFENKWIQLIKECGSIAASLSLQVNGSPTKEFFMQKGLQQGDPLSPFLHNVAAEGLNVLLTKAKSLGLIKGVGIGSHGNVDWVEALTIKIIVRCFEVMSGLKMDFHKSVVSEIGVDENFISDLASIPTCS